jgi:regulator of replication initiation timing
MGNILSSEPDQQSTSTTTHTIYDYTAQQQYRRQVDDYRRRMDDIVRENTALKHYNERLRDQLHEVNLKLENIASNQRKNLQSQPIRASVSTEHIKQYVDEMLENQDINIYGFPDAIEKQIYRNMFNMLLNVVDHTLDTSEVVLFGHKIVFDIQPLDSVRNASITDNLNGSSIVAKGVAEITTCNAESKTKKQKNKKE